VVIVTRSGGGALVSATDGSQAIGARHPAVRDSALRADIFMAALAVELASGRGAVRATQTAEVVRVLARLDRARDMALPSAAEIERVRRAHYTGHLEPRRAGSSDRGGG
jgi:sugar/nucleoside kinase (ribokinase family)